MPRKPIDYSNTHFYKIVCKDTNIKSLYVGHTTDFTKRKAQHKGSCLNPNNSHYDLLLYQTIRNNGNWDNWDMIEIETKSCENNREAKRIEREYIEQLKADLNRPNPYSTLVEKQEYNKQWRQDNKEQLQKYMKIYKEQHAEELNNYSNNYQKENQELIRERSRLHYQNNKEHYKNYREDNREILQERNKTYYNNNKSRVIERTTENNRQRAKVSVICECGITVKKPNMSKHRKSNFHQTYEQSINDETHD